MATIIRTTLPVVDAIGEVVEARGLSTRAAARELGVAHQTITNWLRGSNTPSLSSDLQHRVARFLGVSPRRVVELFELDLSSCELGGYRAIAA